VKRGVLAWAGLRSGLFKSLLKYEIAFDSVSHGGHGPHPIKWKKSDSAYVIFVTFAACGPLWPCTISNSTVSFNQALVSLARDGTKVNENICPIVAADEPVTLSIVKPFNCSL
jgi:hypothetical protein